MELEEQVTPVPCLTNQTAASTKQWQLGKYTHALDVVLGWWATLSVDHNLLVLPVLYSYVEYDRADIGKTSK